MFLKRINTKSKEGKKRCETSRPCTRGALTHSKGPHTKMFLAESRVPGGGHHKLEPREPARLSADVILEAFGGAAEKQMVLFGWGREPAVFGNAAYGCSRRIARSRRILHNPLAVETFFFAATNECHMALPVVAIVGRPNVGKSSLVQFLARQLVSIVEPTGGVTRRHPRGRLPSHADDRNV